MFLVRKSNGEMQNGNKTFIKITNKNIFDKLEIIEKSLIEFHEVNGKEHEKIKGSLVLQHWMILGALAMAGTAITWLWMHVSG